jgi:hypothetical protein
MMQAKIVLPSPPDKSLSIFDSHRSLLFSAIDIQNRRAGAPSVSELVVNRALGIWSISVEEILMDRDLSGAEHAGWVFIVSDKTGVCGATEISSVNNSEEFVFGGVLGLDFVNSIFAGIRVLESVNLPENSVFEMRLLRVPKAYFNGLWLAGPSDLIVPLQPLLFWSEHEQLLDIDDLKDRMSTASRQLASQEAP